jgi:excisionase family DNA binding protein
VVSAGPATLRRYLSVPEVAERYGVSAAVIYEWTSAGLIPYRKLPGRKALLFLVADLDAYDDGLTQLERRKTPGGGVVVRPRRPT